MQHSDYYPKKQSSQDMEKPPEDTPKRAKRKEIEGQAILTLEPLTMEKPENKGRKMNPKNSETQKQT